MSETNNGRVTIRDVYDIVGKVDTKVDRVLECAADHEKRLALVEERCEARPAHCALEHAATRRQEREDREKGKQPLIHTEVERMSRRVWVMWGLLIFVGATTGSALIAWAVSAALG